MENIKLSIVIAFYESYGVVERQIKHFRKMNLPNDIEFVFVDDGSSPAHPQYDLKNLTMVYTNDKRAWTQGLARNAGAEVAKGEYVFFTDIDHILSKEAIMDAYNMKGDRMLFPRYIGVLDEEGVFTQDLVVLEAYGAILDVIRGPRGLYASYHGNTFAIKKETFKKLGGYCEKYCTNNFHAKSGRGEDGAFNHAWNKMAQRENIKAEIGSSIFIFPIGRYHVNYDLNPRGLFHTLSYEAVPQPNKN
jgi:glycosyltransferase involved in cell wall biosynthesis